MSSSVVAESGALKGRVVNATAWSVGAEVSAHVLRLAGNVVLARLVTPAVFGLMAIGNSVLVGVHLFSDVGIGASVVQHERGADPRFLNTLWTVQVVRGALVALVCAGFGWPAARVYDAPELVWLLPLIGSTALIQGFNSTRIFSLKRELMIGRITLVELAASVAGIVTMIAWAWASPSVLALAVGGIVSTAMIMFGSHAILPGIVNRLEWDSDAARELIRFGRWIFLNTAMTFLALHADRLFLGALAPLSVVGVYGFALAIAQLPLPLASRIANSVLFPGLAQVAREAPERFSATVVEARRLMLPACVLLCAAMASAARPFFEYLYEAEYHDAAWMAEMLCALVWLTFLHDSASRALLALGDTFAIAMSTIWNIAIKFPAAGLGYLYYGVPGFIGGLVLGAAIGELALQRPLRRAGAPITGQDLRYTAGAILATAACLAPRHLVALYAPDAPYAELVGYALSGVPLAALALWVLRRLRAAHAGGLLGVG